MIHCIPGAPAVINDIPGAPAVLHRIPGASAIIHCIPGAPGCCLDIPAGKSIGPRGRQHYFTTAGECLPVGAHPPVDGAQNQAKDDCEEQAHIVVRRPAGEATRYEGDANTGDCRSQYCQVLARGPSASVVSSWQPEELQVMTPAPGSAQHHFKLRLLLCSQWQASIWSSRATNWPSNPCRAQSVRNSWTRAGALTCASTL